MADTNRLLNIAKQIRDVIDDTDDNNPDIVRLTEALDILACVIGRQVIGVKPKAASDEP